MSVARPAARTDSPTLAWALSLLIGLVAARLLFPWPVLLGTAPFWTYPRGIFGNSYGDMATSTAGYYTFVRDAWRWPLFQTSGLGNDGINVILTDSIPIVSLLGRFLYRTTGQIVPLFGAWTGLCVVGMALASTGLVRTLGARGWMPAVAAAVIGVSMPAFLGRWGHISLFAQWLIPLTLIFYARLQATSRPRPAAVFAMTLALCVTGLAIFPYFLPMVGGLAAAAILQAATDRRLTPRATIVLFAALIAALAAVMAAMGFWSVGADSALGGFGYYSMNLLSPILPPREMAAAGLATAADATGGQYEGSIFLGAGLLVLALICGRAVLTMVSTGARRHIWLLLATVAFTMWALSSRVYAGPILILSIPLPEALQKPLGIFRSSGRFAWVGLYLFAGLAVLAMSRRKIGGPVLLLLAALQWAGAAPLRASIRASVAGPSAPLLDRAAWEALLPGADRLVVDPPHDCLGEGPDQLRRALASVELELMAAEAGVPTNTVYAGRPTADCSIPLPTARSIVVYLRAVVPQPGLTCRTGELMTVCGALPANAPDSLAAIGQPVLH